MEKTTTINPYDRCHQLASEWRPVSKETADDCSTKWPDTFSTEHVKRRSVNFYYVDYTWGYRFDRFFASN